MKTATQYGQEAYTNGITRVCDDKTFMQDMKARGEKNVMRTLKEWKAGHAAALRAAVLEQFKL